MKSPVAIARSTKLRRRRTTRLLVVEEKIACARWLLLGAFRFLLRLHLLSSGDGEKRRSCWRRGTVYNRKGESDGRAIRKLPDEAEAVEAALGEANGDEASVVVVRRVSTVDAVGFPVGEEGEAAGAADGDEAAVVELVDVQHGAAAVEHVQETERSPLRAVRGGRAQRRDGDDLEVAGRLQFDVESCGVSEVHDGSSRERVADERRALGRLPRLAGSHEVASRQIWTREGRRQNGLGGLGGFSVFFLLEELVLERRQQVARLQRGL
mmetsp:Transcript_16672/g.50511  ORF Transcript_16672/g.50511 Transcript_16672/m.50511 type:complete len:267 (+) Transcript_16672:379-1179(+)